MNSLFKIKEVVTKETYKEMEYLPEKKRTQKTQILKKEQKIHQFRQQLVDNNVVLAIVKCKSPKLITRLFS